MVVQGEGERETRMPFTHSVRWRSRHRQQRRQLSVRPACAPERVSPIKSRNELRGQQLSTLLTLRVVIWSPHDHRRCLTPVCLKKINKKNKSTWMVWPCALLKHRVRCGSFRWIGPTVSLCASSEGSPLEICLCETEERSALWGRMSSSVPFKSRCP